MTTTIVTSIIVLFSVCLGYGLGAAKIKNQYKP